MVWSNKVRATVCKLGIISHTSIHVPVNRVLQLHHHSAFKSIPCCGTTSLDLCAASVNSRGGESANFVVAS